MHTIAGDPSLPPMSHSETVGREKKKLLVQIPPGSIPRFKRVKSSLIHSLQFSDLKIMEVVIAIKGRVDKLMSV